MNNSNTLLLHSGGLDSSILGCELAKQGINFSSVFIDFGQSGKNSELKATKSASSILGAAYMTVTHTVAYARGAYLVAKLLSRRELQI